MRYLIGIAGGSGSGKTALAEKIARQVGKANVLLISLDSYYRDLSKLKLADREQVNFDHPKAFEWPLLKRQINQLLKGKAVKMPIYSFVRFTRVGQQLVKPKPVIILEGIFALYDKQLNQLMSIKIFVDTEPDIRFIRRLQRDVKERCYSVKAVTERWVKSVKPTYDEFIEPTKRAAHLIIPEDPEGRMRGVAIDLLKTKIKSMLKSKRK